MEQRDIQNSEKYSSKLEFYDSTDNDVYDRMIYLEPYFFFLAKSSFVKTYSYKWMQHIYKSLYINHTYIKIFSIF